MCHDEETKQMKKEGVDENNDFAIYPSRELTFWVESSKIYLLFAEHDEKNLFDNLLHFPNDFQLS
jgi:hypothetical protein